MENKKLQIRNIYHLLLIISVSIVCIFMISSCTKTDAKSLDSTNIAFIDDDGNAITLHKPYKRIIALYSAHTENIFQLGAGASIIGGHTTCDYPTQANSLPKYDYSGDPEYIIASEPDLVLIRPFIRKSKPNYISEIEKAGILVVSLYPETFDDFDSYIKKLAMLTDTEKIAEKKLNEFHAELDKIKNENSNMQSKKNIFFEATENEYRTAALGSLPAIAIDISGGINIASHAKPIGGSSIAAFGDEKLLEAAHKIDLYIVQEGAMNRTKNLSSLLKRPGFKSIKAVRDGNVLFINEKLISSPTFRYLQGVKIIADKICCLDKSV